MLAVLTLASLLSASAFAPTGRVATSSLKMAEPFCGGLAGADGPELKKVKPAHVCPLRTQTSIELFCL